MNESVWDKWIIQTAGEWDDIKSSIRMTGVDRIDMDHKILIKYSLELNKIVRIMHRQKYDLDLINRQRELIQKLYAFTLVHFNREEEIIRKYKLSGTKDQVKQHHIFIGMFKKFIADFDSGKITATFEITVILLEWIINHINQVDQETFALTRWSSILMEAKQWDDVRPIIKSTGLNQVDDDHKKITRFLIQLNNEDSEDTAKIEDIFEKLYRIVVKHFQNEQEIMEKYELPIYKAHLKLHTFFIHKVEEYREKYRIDREMKLYIIKWWINHINTTDFFTFRSKKWILKVIEKSKKMEDIGWLLKYTGIKEIDNDHKQLVKYSFELNTLVNKVYSGIEVSKEEKISIIDRIYHYAREHFNREEKIMKELKPDLLEEHRMEHKELLDICAYYRENIAAGRINISHNLKIKILDWWLEHTNGVDYITFCT